MDVFSKVNKWLVWGMGIVFAMGFQSCLDDDNDNWYGKVIPNALVTVKNVDDGSFFLQLDDSTTLLPINVASSPFGEKEVRALVNYDEVDEVSGRYSKAVHINWIDSILTKPIAPDLGEENDVVYGTDPVEIVRDWVTIAEDGYLTLRFRTEWGDRFNGGTDSGCGLYREKVVAVLSIFPFIKDIRNNKLCVDWQITEQQNIIRK